jgi:hypothetical protein
MGVEELKKYLKEKASWQHLGQYSCEKYAKALWYTGQKNARFQMYIPLRDFLRGYAYEQCKDHSGEKFNRWTHQGLQIMDDYAKKNKKWPPRDDLREMYYLYNNGKPGEGTRPPAKEEKKEEPIAVAVPVPEKILEKELEKEVEKEVEKAEVKPVKKRCPKGSRKNAEGNCVKTTETVTKKQKRCPKGTRKNKDGDCIKK